MLLLLLPRTSTGDDVPTPASGDSLQVVVAEYVEDVRKALPALEDAIREEDAHYRRFEGYKRQIRADAVSQRAVLALALARFRVADVDRARENWSSWADIARSRAEAAKRTLEFAQLEAADETERWDLLRDDDLKSSADGAAVFAKAREFHRRKTEMLERLEARAQAGIESADEALSICDSTLDAIKAAENRARSRFLSTRTGWSDFGVGLVDLRDGIADLGLALRPASLRTWARGLVPVLQANAGAVASLLIGLVLLCWYWRRIRGLLRTGAARLVQTPNPPRLLAAALLLACGQVLVLLVVTLVAFFIQTILGATALDWTNPPLAFLTAVLIFQFSRRLIREVFAPEDTARRWLIQDDALAEYASRYLILTAFWILVSRVIILMPWGTFIPPPPVTLSVFLAVMLALWSIRRVLGPQVVAGLRAGPTAARATWASRFALDLVAVLAIGVVAVGYLNFATFMVWGLVRSLVLLATSAVIWRAGVDLLEPATAAWPDRARQTARRAWAAFVIGAVVVALPSVWNSSRAAIEAAQRVLAFGVDVGEQHITVLRLVVAALWLTAAIVGGRFVSALVERGLSNRSSVEVGLRTAIGRSISYVLVFAGVVIAILSLGFDLTNLAIVAGALGVGVGLGLQMLVSNFVSGLVILYERPFRIGDILEHEGLLGTVWRIQVRSTVLRTLDEAEIVVPNSELVGHKIVNWTLSNNRARMSIKVGVAYGSDVVLVRDTLLRVAKAHKRVLETPRAYFSSFGDSSLDFTLMVWVDIRERLDVLSELHFAIDAAFREAGIKIPFPQRDVHFFPQGN